MSGLEVAFECEASLFDEVVRVVGALSDEVLGSAALLAELGASWLRAFHDAMSHGNQGYNC